MHPGREIAQGKAECYFTPLLDALITRAINPKYHTKPSSYIYIYTNRCGKLEVILGPAGRVLHTWLAGKNLPVFLTEYSTKLHFGTPSTCKSFLAFTTKSHHCFLPQYNWH